MPTVNSALDVPINLNTAELQSHQHAAPPVNQAARAASQEMC